MIAESKLKEVVKQTKSILKNPESAKAYIARANAYCYLRKFDNAIADCDSAISIEPKNLSARMQRSVAVTLKNHSA